MSAIFVTPQRSFYTEFTFSQSIESLEVVGTTGEGSISARLSAEQIGVLEYSLKEMGNSQIQILEAHKAAPANTVTQVLSVVRSQLLELMLGIEKKFGTEVDIKTLKDNSREIINIMNHIINNNGDGNINNTGANTTITATINITKHDKKSLLQALRDNKVSEADVDELSTVVDIEKPTLKDPSFGTKVQAWLTKMMAKSISGTWEVGVATAGGLLTELLKQYYGIGK